VVHDLYANTFQKLKVLLDFSMCTGTAVQYSPSTGVQCNL
jgi:hypothetical protein